MNRTKKMVRGSLLAALYVVRTLVSSAFGLASGVIQLRLSEAVCILPFFCAEAIPGLFIGCLLANFLSSALPLDILFGSLATLLGAIGARALRRYRYLGPLPTVLANAAIIPPVLIYVYGFADAYPFILMTVTIGEVLSVYALGLPLLYALEKRCKGLFTK